MDLLQNVRIVNFEESKMIIVRICLVENVFVHGVTSVASLKMNVTSKLDQNQV